MAPRDPLTPNATPEGSPLAAGDHETRVPVALPHRPHVAELGAGHEQAYPGVAVAERGQPPQLLGDLVPEALAADDRVDHLGRRGLGLVEGLGAVLGERDPERVDPPRLDLQPGRGTVPAEARQVLAARLQGAEQVEAGNAAPRTPAVALGVEPDQHRRAPVALDDPRGDDPDHAGVPPLTGEHQPGGVAELRRQLAAGALRRVDDVPLDRPPLVVRALELGGDLRPPAPRRP